MEMQTILQYKLEDYDIANAYYKTWPELFQLIVDTLNNIGDNAIGNIEDVVALIRNIGGDGKADFYIDSLNNINKLLKIDVVYFDPIDVDKNLSLTLVLKPIINIDDLISADKEYVEKALGVN